MAATGMWWSARSAESRVPNDALLMTITREDTMTPIYQIGYKITEGTLWKDVDKETYERRKAAKYMEVRVVYREAEVTGETR
jgi:hypothetical protein